MSGHSTLTMTFDPKTIEHLGVKMYSTLPPVLAELIANSYDAYATKVEVALYDNERKKRIVVKDDGIGMSEDDIRNKFLVIGRNRRQEGDEKPKSRKRRKPIGKKGLGKLSFFGVVKIIEVETIKNKKKNVFVMNWDKLMKSDGNYEIVHKVKNEAVNKKSGTTVTLSSIKRKGRFSAENVANSVSRFFIVDKDFNIYVSHNDENKIKITNEMRFNLLNPEFVWNSPNDLKTIKEFSYLKKFKIRGRVMTSKEPIRPSTNARGITLFSRNKLVQSPYQFAEGTSSHFFSYLTGWLEVDFIDDLEEDVISTNRQSLNWENVEMKKLHSTLQKCLGYIQREWRRKRNQDRRKKIAKEAPSEWFDSIPADMKKKVEGLLFKVGSFSSLNEKDVSDVLNGLVEIMPAYPFYHWRNLHKKLKDPLFDLYKKGSYLEAAKDGGQIYEEEVVKKSKVDKYGLDLFNKVFSVDNFILEIKSPFTSEATRKNIQKGQRSLSTGFMESFRNPVHHSVRKKTNAFFNENDFLDVLSLLSFLLRRVDSSKRLVVKKQSPNNKRKQE